MPVELLPPGEAHPSNPEWHRLRRHGVTASEIPVILGLSTWDSPWSLWHRKRGLIGDPDAGESADWGRRLEPAIAEAWQERHMDLTVRPAGLFAHDSRAWQMATPDGIVRERRLCGRCDAMVSPVCTCEVDELTDPPVALLELKHPWSWDGWGDDGTDDIPPAYAAQCLWQLDVMGLDECWLAAYTRHEMRTYVIRASAEGADVDLEMMRKAALDFLVSTDPPPLDSHPATLRAVKALHPDVEDRDQEVMPEVARAYRSACRDLRAAEARKREAEAALRLAMGNARRAMVLDPDGWTPVATRSVFERRSLDGKRLRTDHPDIAETYSTTTTVDSIRPARKDSHDED